MTTLETELFVQCKYFTEILWSYKYLNKLLLSPASVKEEIMMNE
jgi:hypothetical protein